VLQTWLRIVPFAASQSAPPCFAGIVIVKKDVWLPPAHCAVQLDQLLQVPVQLIGQGVGLMQLVVDLRHARCKK
jgi:hypothetical protein